MLSFLPIIKNSNTAALSGIKEKVNSVHSCPYLLSPIPSFPSLWNPFYLKSILSESILITLVKVPSDKAKGRASVLIHLELSKALGLVTPSSLKYVVSLASGTLYSPGLSWTRSHPPFLLGGLSWFLLTFLVLKQWRMPGLPMDLVSSMPTSSLW